MPKLLMLLISLAAATPRVEASPGQVAEVPFSDAGDGGIVVPVWIDGRGPYRFLLDTGSTLSVVSQSLADRLSLRPVARTALTTVGGIEMRLVVQFAEIRLGGVGHSGLLASVANDAELAMASPGLDGILGQDFFATYNFTVDYERRRLVWDHLSADPQWPDRSGTIRLPLVPRDGRFIVRLPQPDGEEELELVPDTGASTFVLFSGSGRPASPREWSDAAVTISGLTGSQPARYSRLRELRIGSLTLRNIPVVVVARDDEGHEGADGLLPLHGFRRAAFRLSEGYLALER